MIVGKKCFLYQTFDLIIMKAFTCISSVIQYTTGSYVYYSSVCLFVCLFPCRSVVMAGGGAAGVDLSRKFVTEAELDEKRKKRQEEWEKVRKPEDPVGKCVVTGPDERTNPVQTCKPHTCVCVLWTPQRPQRRRMTHGPSMSGCKSRKTRNKRSLRSN